MGSGPGILKTLPRSGSGDMSPTPYSPGRVGPDLTLPLLTWTQGPPCPQWAGVPAARPLEEVGVISGPVPSEPLTKMQEGEGEVPAPLPSTVSRQEKLFLSRFAADRPGFLLSWLELILEARGPGTARSSSKYTQAAAPPAPTTKQGWVLLRKVGHLGSWPTTRPISRQASGTGAGNSLEEVWRDWKKEPRTGRQEASLTLTQTVGQGPSLGLSLYRTKSPEVTIMFPKT